MSVERQKTRKKREDEKPTDGVDENVSGIICRGF